MLYEVLSHAFAFDFGWFIPFIIDNLFWVFALACLGVFIYGKNPIIGAIFVAIYLYATFDFATALGWVFRKDLFWAPVIVFVAKILYDGFFHNTKHAAKLPWFASIVFYLALFFINVIMS